LAYFLQVIAINCIRLSNSNPYLPSGFWSSLHVVKPVHHMQLLVVSCNCNEFVISSEQARGYSQGKRAAWCFGNERRPTTANCFASLYQNCLNASEHLLGQFSRSSPARLCTRAPLFEAGECRLRFKGVEDAVVEICPNVNGASHAIEQT
jgi:hypothetical protein